MLIVIEGIDGSGKSTAAAMVAERLSTGRAPSSPTPGGKKAIGPTDRETEARAVRLRDLIWSSPESAGDTFGATHWILLIASWYAGLTRLRPDLQPSHPGVCVMDGWFYRNIAKTLVREPLDPQWVESLFAPAPEPDLVVLLDVPPDVAWERRETFKDTELGRWDGFSGPAREAFCAYQSVIRQELMRMADQRKWLVLSPDRHTTAEQTAAAVVEHVTRAERTAAGAQEERA
ncbi:hypothetical protein G3I40_03435 [Streptomyces sp. SID14478]|uniref:dTMP kinase n=1 Tax=Streptomyces sp. SID14478 TaxID=2706073 RepID=UPI0013DAE7B9|nr:hypothetical protein [Streptomyces sp. SID14478]NEB74293.1 hypothetical protein [Streptomyces sp. SID14478]